LLNPLLHFRHYSFPDDLPPSYSQLFIIDYSRNSWNQIGTDKVLSYIALPLPTNLIDYVTTDFQIVDLGVTGAAVLGGIDAVSRGGVGGAATDARQAIQNEINRLRASGSARDLEMAAVLAADLAGLPIANSAQAWYGFRVNRFLQIMLRGSNFKRYQFRWLLSPRNETEAQVINDIGITFKDIMTPALGPGLLGSAFFLFPKLLLPRFYYFDKNNESKGNLGRYLFMTRPCVIEQCIVSYAPGQVALHAVKNNVGPTPHSVEIQLILMETELWQGSPPGQIHGDYYTYSRMQGQNLKPSSGSSGVTGEW
jgi:hypothetical protein